MPEVLLSFPGSSYTVVIEPGLLSSIGERTRTHVPHQKCGLLADQNVFDRYGSAVLTSLERSGYQVTVACQPSGEEHKTLETVKKFYHALLADALERRSPILTLGGGVNGDTAGFVASTYLRGVPFLQIPTTLLAMVDASVGGKVGVNLPEGKNLVGSFYQPKAVFIDPVVLTTLSPREFRSGLAECVKHAVIADEDLFAWTEEHVEEILRLEVSTLTKLIERNVQIKADIVLRDEKESGVRAHLNLGHTFGHAIERTSGYGVLQHGEAVSLGLIAAAALSEKLGRSEPSLTNRLRRLLERLELPTRATLVEEQELLDAMRLDKKVAGGKIRLVLPRSLGSVGVYEDVADEDILWAWKQIKSHPRDEGEQDDTVGKKIKHL